VLEEELMLKKFRNTEFECLVIDLGVGGWWGFEKFKRFQNTKIDELYGTRWATFFLKG